MAAPIDILTMPMMIATCRFDAQLPDRAVLTNAIVAKLGRVDASEVELELDGSLVHMCSMDRVFLVYAQRACVEVGGTICDPSGAPRERTWPAWVAGPWFKLGWWAKACIRLGNW